MINTIVNKFLLSQKKGQGYFCIAVDEQLKIVDYTGEAKLLGLKNPKYKAPIFDYLPILVTELFDSNFEIPFYNIDHDHVCNINFLKSDKLSYLVLVDKTEIFHVTQKYQQFAHNDNITKNKFKRLAENLKKAKQKLKKANQEKATLIAMLSHELGTPLTSILGYTELLLNNDINTDKGLKIIHRNAVYLKQMIENTLIFGRSEAGGINPHIEEIKIQDLFSTLNTIIFPTAKIKQLSVQITYPDNDIINIDIARTKQILINLLNNAVKYSDEGFVELKYSLKNNHHVFSVIDSGIGIPQDQQVNIFSPWERVNEYKTQGAGIGLFISQNLAHAIGANLKLKYSSLEFGSIFQLIIPLQNIEPTNEIDYLKKENPCRGKSILVIDDDNDILDLIQVFLQPSGLTIFTATNMLSAQLLLKKNNIDLVVTDYYLGTIKADSYLDKIKRKHKVPVLLMSALPSKNFEKSYKSQGFDAVISKPIDRKSLLATIIKHLNLG